MKFHSKMLQLLLLGGACGPDDEIEEAREYSDALCEATITCECASRFDSIDECSDEFSTRFETFLDADYTFDRSCFDRVIDSLRSDPCSPVPWNGEMPCASFSGGAGEGSPCSPHSELPPLVALDCAEGLVCHDGSCTKDASTGVPKAEGESCKADYLGSCHAAELYCGSDNVCHEWKQLGEMCEPLGCIPPLYCEGSGSEGSGICAEPKAMGEACQPLDWGACAPSSEPDTVVVCDSVDQVCTLGEPLCPSLNFPSIW